ncbi:MAG TPA: response regulator [Candidatus Nitrosocosmicus sp.]|nr:response regulator [Candidatus Nitrosocosmicus sp.]
MTVDNNVDLLEALSDYCCLESIECDVASNGLQGLFKMQEKEYDLILLDIAMPEYSGVDILHQLKKQGVRNKNIVVITATDLKIKDFDDYYEVGVKEVLSKPTELWMIDKVMTKYRGRLKKAYPLDIKKV